MLTKYIEKNKTSFVLPFFVVAINSVMNVCITLVLKELIDRGVEGNFEKIKYTIVLTLVYILCYFLYGKFAIYFLQNYKKKYVVKLKNFVFDHILKKSVEEYVKYDVGNYISTLQNDVSIIEECYLACRLDIVEQICTLFCGTMCMLYLNWIIAIVVILFSTIIILSSKFFSSNVEFWQKKFSETSSRGVETLKVALEGFTTIKSFSIEERVKKDCAEAFELVQDSKCKLNQKTQFMYLSLTGLSLLTIIVIFSLGAILNAKGMITIGSIVAFVQVINYIMGPIQKISVDYIKIQSTNSVKKSIDELLFCEERTLQPLINDKIEKVELQDIHYLYNEKIALDSVSVTFEKGKSYAIVGENGCGKSTLAKILSGLYKESTGKIFVNNRLLSLHESNSYLNKVTYMQQEPFMLKDTIYNNITLYQEYDKSKVYEIIQLLKIDEIMQKHGEKYIIGTRENELSGGEKQRIALARTLLKEHDILIIDEGLSAIDCEGKTKILDMVLKKKSGIGIFITHDLRKSELKKYDRIVYLKKGRIEASGGYDDILQSNKDFENFVL